MPVERSLCVWLDSYRRDVKTSISTAAAQGFATIQPNLASSPELAADEMTASARRHFSRYLRDVGMGIDALAAAFPGAGLAEPRDAERRLGELRRTVDLAREMGVRRALVTIGSSGDESSSGLVDEMIRAAAELSDAAQVDIAILPTGTAIASIAAAVARLDCNGLRLAVDTAAICGQQDDWAKLTGCLHLRDGRRVGDNVEEVEFGRGDVDFRTVLARFARGDREPPSLVVRQDRAGPVDALRAGREYVASLFPGGGR